jgi:Zn-dependent M28 family amino/carboxypeptidase
MDNPGLASDDPGMKFRSGLVPTALAAAVLGQGPPPLGENPAAAVEATITPQALAAHIRFLADDLLEGRGVGTRADHLTRLYLRTQLASFGLAGGAADGGFDQAVPIVGITATVARELSIQRGTESMTLRAPDDYTAVAGNADPEATWRDAELVFVGYGIHAPEQEWDDYKGADLRGKVLLFMNDDPSSDPALFAGKTRLYYGRWSYKYEEAARRGAVGAIVIHTTPSAGYPFQVVQSNHGREAFWLPFAAGAPSIPIRAWCTEDAARRLASFCGHDLDALRRTAESRQFRPVPFGATAALALANKVRQFESGNVLAKLEGSDPERRQEVVVVTAHFDHLGIGPEKKGDSIYNGALDNGTGSAALLVLARACSLLEPRPRRTILFAAVTAEESGLLGSQHLAQNLPVDRKRVAANFNIDGLNIWGRSRDLEMIGYGKNSLTALAEAVAASRGRRLTPDSEPQNGLFYRSDHFNFARIGVPAAYFKSGHEFLDNPDGKKRVKAMWTTVHYHQPSDEYDARWDLGGAADDVRLLLECLVRTCNADEPPTWTKGDEFERLR